MSDTPSGTKPVKWGIIGAGKIARHAFAPAVHASHNGELAAVASRTRERAREIAAEIGASRAHASYEELIADPEVEAVYIGLPNGMHEEWTVRAAKTGKHVLCEKSLTLTHDSALRMADACCKANVHLVEAFMYRHHPQWETVLSLIREAAIGELRSVEAAFSGTLGDDTDHRWHSELGGGAFFDLTCYAINACRYVTAAEPIRVSCIADGWKDTGVDRMSKVVLEFGNGILASATGSFVSAVDQYVRIRGTRGVIIVNRPFGPGTNPVDVTLLEKNTTKNFHIAGANQFLIQVEHFAKLVRGEASPFPTEDGRANVRVCEAARESWQQGRTINLP